MCRFLMCHFQVPVSSGMFQPNQMARSSPIGWHISSTRRKQPIRVKSLLLRTAPTVSPTSRRNSFICSILRPKHHWAGAKRRGPLFTRPIVVMHLSLHQRRTSVLLKFKVNKSRLAGLLAETVSLLWGIFVLFSLVLENVNKVNVFF